MFTTLALAVALSSALGQSEQLTISNARATYGRYGPARADDKLLPADTYWVAFDVDGFKVDKEDKNKEDKILYTMSMQVTNEKGKVVYGIDPLDQESQNILGGSNVPSFSFFSAGTHPPGEYTLKVNIMDRNTKAKVTLTRKFEILSKGFGLVDLHPSYDSDGRSHAPASGVTGQWIWITFNAVGFERDNKTKQPDVALEMRVLDENGKQTVPKPFRGRINSGVDRTAELLPMSYRFGLNRPGKFSVELHATDKVAKKEVKLSFPITVTEQK